MRPWRSWNDSTPQICSLPKGGRNASLIVPRKTAPLVISADLFGHLLEVCLDFRKALTVIIVAEPRQWKIPTGPRPRWSEQAYRSCFQLLTHPKNHIENT